jgi:hypothetical protein
MSRSVAGPPHRALLWRLPRDVRRHGERTRLPRFPRPLPARISSGRWSLPSKTRPHFHGRWSGRERPARIHMAAGPGRERSPRISHGRWSWPSKTSRYFTWPPVLAVKDQPAFRTAAGPGRQTRPHLTRPLVPAVNELRMAARATDGSESHPKPDRHARAGTKPSGHRIAAPRRRRSRNRRSDDRSGCHGGVEPGNLRLIRR